MLYFDYAATSWPKPEAVISACTEAMMRAGNPGRGAHPAALYALRLLYEAREAVAEVFGADPMEIVFAQNCTMALNEAIHQVDGEIVTTPMEHNSVLRPCAARGNFRIAEADGGALTAEAVIDAIGDATKAVVMTHASNLTGEIYDIGTVGRYCRERGILFIVDAAQSAGVVPIDVKAMCIDMLAFSGHKGLLGPMGTGGLYVGSHLKPKPFMRGGTGSISFDLHQPEAMPDVLEAGTQNIHGLAGLKAGAAFVLDRGVENILKREQQLCSRFIEGTEDIPNICIYRKNCRRTGTVALNVQGIDSGDMCSALAAKGVCVRGGAHCAPLAHKAIHTEQTGAVRFSFGWATTEADIDAGIAALKACARGLG